MLLLVLGLVLFLGVHSTRIVADGWRTSTIRRIGEKPWKGLYALASIVGFALIVYGFGLARQNPVVLWPQPPVATRHIAALLTLLAFVLFFAPYVPRNHFKARLRHPQLIGVKVWALAHLIANNTLADLLLFGGFLLWAVLAFRAARKRDRALAAVPPAGTAMGTAITVAIGIVAWVAFAFWAHARWIGVAPMGVSA
ncbi:NnrU family protein [Ramlibacter sp. PS3R-8]|uniref:NnrU family protein n=1 Tax=Ramlibacter sp. PS3R-8 TaxID=3133437 RepID=UPI0030B5FCE0